MAGTRSKPSDFTGRQRESEASKSAQAVAEREGQISMARQIELDREDTDVFDPASNESLGNQTQVVLDDTSEVVIRVVEDIEDMTLGAGTHYTFAVGKKYKVSRSVADHLASIGYLVGV